MLPQRLRAAFRGSSFSTRTAYGPAKRSFGITERLDCKCREPSHPQRPAHDELSATDYRSIGERNELFSNSVYSRGSPFFHPDGTYVFQKLQAFLRSQYTTYGFREVITPLLYKQELWQKSGHAQNYKDDMFEVTGVGNGLNAERISHEFGLKPMNCPGHCLLFSRHRKSHRDLPVRYAEFSPLHRNENDGALSGLTRARCFHQDDGHIFCTRDQVGQEIRRTLDFVRRVYQAFDLGRLKFVLSTRPEHKYIGDVTEWDDAETQLKEALDDSRKELMGSFTHQGPKNTVGPDWTLNPGDGAFYGPKIDIILTDRNGKEHQTATVQLDFQLPQRFDLSYDGPDGKPERPILIHRAILGSIERFMALLIERYQNQWPFWLSPRKAIMLSVNSDHIEYGKAIISSLDGTSMPCRNWHPHSLVARTYRIDSDFTDSTIGAKVRAAKLKGYNLIMTVGAKEVSENTVSINFEGQANHEYVERIVKSLRRNNADEPQVMLSRIKLQSNLLMPLIEQIEDQIL